jgi:hypothetical protein
MGRKEKTMSALAHCARTCILAAVILAAAAAGTTGVAFWQADAAQPEERIWVRDGDAGCRHVRASEAIGARPCQS